MAASSWPQIQNLPVTLENPLEEEAGIVCDCPRRERLTLLRMPRPSMTTPLPTPLNSPAQVRVVGRLQRRKATERI